MSLEKSLKILILKVFCGGAKLCYQELCLYFITGAITASGGAWNASIVAEVVSWGDKKIVLKGIGSYISQMTVEADFHRIFLGIGVMSICIALINHFFWQPLYNYSAKKYKF